VAKRKKAKVARKPSKAKKKATPTKGAARKRTPKAKTRAIPPSAVTTELEVTPESAAAVWEHDEGHRVRHDLRLKRREAG